MYFPKRDRDQLQQQHEASQGMYGMKTGHQTICVAAAVEMGGKRVLAFCKCKRQHLDLHIKYFTA